KARASQEDLNKKFVRTNEGTKTTIKQIRNLKRFYGPQTVERFNLFTTDSLSGGTKPGYSSGDTIKESNEVSQNNLSTSYGIDFAGLSRQEINAGSQTAIIFVLCLVFVYFILSAQYESYLLPLAVILSLPGGMMGAYWAQKLAGLENNIYFQ